MSSAQPGSAIQVGGPAIIDGNLIMNADNHGLWLTAERKRALREVNGRIGLEAPA